MIQGEWRFRRFSELAAAQRRHCRGRETASDAIYLRPKTYAEDETDNHPTPGCSHERGRPDETPNAGSPKLHA